MMDGNSRRHSLVALTIAALVIVTSARASATTFDGTFMRTGNGLVEYFSLTQTRDQVAGFIFSIVSDPSSTNGLKETRVNVSGVTDGDRVNFRQGQGDFSTTLGWIARGSGDGFSLSYQANGGYLVTNRFQAASSDDLNRAIASLRTTVYSARATQAAAQQRANVQSDYYATLSRLKRDAITRPQLLAAISAAKRSMAAATAKQSAAADAMTKANEAVDEAQRNADDAETAAQNADDRQHAADLRQVTADRRQGVADVRQQISSANADARYAQTQIAYATGELARFDARVGELQQNAQRDKIFLNGR